VRATKGDKRGRPSRTIWRERKKRAEVRRLTSFERFICERENFVFDSLIYLEPVERFKNRSKVMKFRIFNLCPTICTAFIVLTRTWNESNQTWNTPSWLINRCATKRKFNNHTKITHTKNSCIVDGLSRGVYSIAKLFADKYRDLYSSVPCDIKWYAW